MVDITDQANNLVDFLQQKAAAGNLVSVTKKSILLSTNGVVVSYTPPAGRTFVLVKASAQTVGLDNTASSTMELRNNGAVKEYGLTLENTINGFNAQYMNFILAGDQLIGDGSKTYDIYVEISGGSGTFNGTITGYLL